MEIQDEFQSLMDFLGDNPTALWIFLAVMCVLSLLLIRRMLR